jgi:hypothetical protein
MTTRKNKSASTTPAPVEQEPASVALDELRTEIPRNGARAAYDALLAVARDPKAPAPARATAGVAILRASGLFEKSDAADESKPLSEMTPEELNHLIRRHERELKRAAAVIAKEEAGLASKVDVFD